MELLSQIWAIALLVFGFGFVVFFHELGHFLAAKYVGIKVEQFAVGFGQAICSWRKGMGFGWGSSGRRLEEIRAQAEAGGKPVDLSPYGDTEYRLNWIPLGGYVKMLGQDDLRPNAQADDPRAYNKKSIPARMLVVSAGVIMNILLAAFGFMVLFLMGYHVPPAVVGTVLSGSPAENAVRIVDRRTERAPLTPGDRILIFDGKYQHDFTKISLNVALVEEGAAIPTYVRRTDGREEWVRITPTRRGDDPAGFLSLGIGKPLELRGPEKESIIPADYATTKTWPAQTLSIGVGDVITQVNGKDVRPQDYHLLDQALQQSDGKPVTLTVRSADGRTRQQTLTPRLETPFSGRLTFAGMIPRLMVRHVPPQSPAFDKLLPEDAIVSVASGGDKQTAPSFEDFRSYLNSAGQAGRGVDVEVLRDGKTVLVEGITPNVKLPDGQYGLSVTLDYYDPTPVVSAVASDSPAAKAGLPAGATILSIASQPVKSWFDVRRLLQQAATGHPVIITAQVGEETRTFSLPLDAGELRKLAAIRYGNPLLLTEVASVLHDRIEVRKTSNPALAAWWGVTETRDFVLQFYLTLQRMFQGSVSYKNMMGPVGIVTAGAHFAFKGMDWLIWFLSMISANLAVVNFLPIPIVDGGLFAFLILEKIQGRPLSHKAQSIAQFVGLAVILSVFLLVTYQDILRLIR